MWRLASGGGCSGNARLPSLLAPALCCALLVCSSPAFAFRTGEDSDALSGKGRVAWADGNVDFYLSREGLPEPVSEADAVAAVEDALAAWQKPECTSVKPRFAGWADEAPTPEDEVNTIGWISDWHAKDLPTSAPGNTDLAYRGSASAWHIAEADVLLNAEDFDWAELSLTTVLTHELGHALGLNHPCEDGGADGAPNCAKATELETSSVMYPDYDPMRAALGEDDVAGICYLYPGSQECDGGCGPRGVCIDDRCHETCGDAVCKADEACGAWGCAPANGCLALDCEPSPRRRWTASSPPKPASTSFAPRIRPSPKHPATMS